ncbi:transglutaminase family protein [Erythrobacteraceae bacterium CFH 75059]|uniref:transglutaminase family protein n=1 Tax=Qipengyuania thermophila TaxID=2509361 RepID=UPI001021E84D|nr:transglutaminase family protein [Qipengyuania thermophila]TCD04308.1 transglutaminase family protein [Erythrobacteraceae bacterium CFH 75059]
MPTVEIEHITRYSYRQPVAFGEHRILMRPRESYDQRLLDAQLDIDPAPEALRWIHDVFGNAVAIAGFGSRASCLEVRASAKVRHTPTQATAIAVEDYAVQWPFQYAAEDLPDLSRAIERQHPDRDREVDRWVGRFLRSDGRTPTLDLLTQITCAIHERFAYRPREEEGTQTPLDTLERGSGTCRDFAVLMMDAVRALGLAAQFVSGYLYQTGAGPERVGGHSTHAWVRVFLPGSGWIEFDPTNGIVGSAGLIRVAVARDPAHAKPLTGKWVGPPDSWLDMDVDVRIACPGDEATEPSQSDETREETPC